MERDKNKTAGDIGGDEAKMVAAGTEVNAVQAQAQVGEAVKPENKLKERSAVEKLAEKRAAEFIDNTHMGLLFAFMEKNPGVVLDVFDFNVRDGQIGTLAKRGDSIRVKLGINYCGIDRGMNDRRFKLTSRSALLLSEFEIQREMKEVVDDSRARIMRAFMPPPVVAEKAETKEEQIRKIRKIVFSIMRKRYNFGNVTRKNRRFISLSFKCDAKEGLSLLELSQKAGILEDRDGGAKGFKLNDLANENDWLELMRDYGYKGKNCMPVGVKIEADGKFVRVYPQVDAGDKSGKP